MAERARAGLGPLLQIFAFLRPYRVRVVTAAAALLLTAMATLSLGKGIQVLIDRGLGGSSAQLAQAVGLMLAISALIAAGTLVRFYLVSWLGERASADIRRAVFDNLVQLHPGFYEHNRAGEIMSRLTTDTTLLQTIIGSSLSMALRSSLTLVGALLMMFITNLKLSLVITATVPLVLLPIILFGRRVRRLSTASQDSIASVGSYAGEIIHNIKVVQSYNREGFERDAFAAEVEKAFAIARRRVAQRALLVGGAILLLFCGMGAMMWTGGQDVISGRMSGGELGAFAFYAVMVGSGFATVSEVWGELQRAAGAAERLLQLLAERSAIEAIGAPAHTAGDTGTPAAASVVSAGAGASTPSAVSDASDPSTASAASAAPAIAARAAPGSAAGSGHENGAAGSAPHSASMALRGVVFSYPTRPAQRALDGLDLEIEAGRSLALVGPSGAGKTTVFELLQRFYDPQHGVVSLDGRDVRAFSLHELRERLALVPQQPALFTADVRYNIAYGRPGASDEEIEAAARRAHAHDFITALPEGYASHLGEQGVRLSGGQRQRIALARAILKDPDILLLDEATSALDAESEFQVQQALEEVMAERTTVIIAHRLATIRHVDRIAVLDAGRCIAEGDHHSLLKDSPLYARLAALQFRDG